MNGRPPFIKEDKIMIIDTDNLKAYLEEHKMSAEQAIAFVKMMDEEDMMNICHAFRQSFDPDKFANISFVEGNMKFTDFAIVLSVNVTERKSFINCLEMLK